MYRFQCYRKNKIVLQGWCEINPEFFREMLKNKIIFYAPEKNWNSATEIICLDAFDKIVIDGYLYEDLCNELMKRKEIDWDV